MLRGAVRRQTPDRSTDTFPSSCRTIYLSHTRIPNSPNFEEVMSKPCPKFRSRYVPVTDLFRSSFRESWFIPMWGSFLAKWCCCQAKNPTENLCNTLIFYLKKQHNFTVLGRTGRGNQTVFEHFLTVFSINSNSKFYAWWSDEMVGREEYFCFMKNFCCQSRKTMERSLQTDSTPIFVELHFLQICFVKS